MKRKFVFNWEIQESYYVKEGYWVFELYSGITYITSSYEDMGLFITFLVQSENIVDDCETVIK